MRLIESNHCEGSCMFYFRYYDIDKCELCDSVLFAGDFRSSEEMIARIKGVIHEPVGTLWYNDEPNVHPGYDPCTLDEAVGFMVGTIQKEEKKNPNLLVFFGFFTMKKEDA